MEIITKVGVDTKNHNGGCSVLNGFKKKIESCQNKFKPLDPINNSLKTKPSKHCPD